MVMENTTPLTPGTAVRFYCSDYARYLPGKIVATDHDADGDTVYVVKPSLRGEGRRRVSAELVEVTA